MSTLACVALAALAESAPSLTGPIVKLPNGDGSVRGDRLADLNVNRYLGIPFAAPPVGNGRWASPEPPKPWAPTVRPALHWAPNCAQLSPPAWQTMYHNKSAYSEDCLYLNVFAPEPMPGEQETLDYPVMVWIHGGGYAYGGAHDSELDGTQLADMANVVVVTIQYRLDVFGFLGAESLRSRSSDNSTGNWAMQDQRMALRWVKENIGAFRGNASQITFSANQRELAASQTTWQCPNPGACSTQPSCRVEASSAGWPSHWLGLKRISTPCSSPLRATMSNA